MARYQRYGVYFLPPDGDLADFGAQWLGWDIARGVARDHPGIEGLGKPIRQLTRKPRRYGFHATLKPPFHLAGDMSPDALDAAIAGLCAGLKPVMLKALKPARIGGFVALVPQGETGALDALAAELVRGLDGFRAPPSAMELAKRRLRGLSPAQEANLMAWGYPHVMEEFRFHMTLTGSVGDDQAARVQAALEPVFADLLPAPFPIDAISLVGEDTDKCFHLIHRYALGG